MKINRPLVLSLLLVPSLLLGCSQGVAPYGNHDIDIDYVYDKTYRTVLTDEESVQYKDKLEQIQRDVIVQVEKQLSVEGVTVEKGYESYGDNRYIFSLKKDDTLFSAKYEDGKVVNDYFTSQLSQELNEFIKQDIDLTNLGSMAKSKIGFQLRAVYDDGTQFSSTEDIRNQELEGYLYFDFDATLSSNYKEQFLRSLWQMKKEQRLTDLSIFVTSIQKSSYRSDITSQRVKIDDSIIMASTGTPSYYMDLTAKGVTLYGSLESELEKTDYSIEDIDNLKRERVDYPVEEETSDEKKN